MRSRRAGLPGSAVPARSAPGRAPAGRRGGPRRRGRPAQQVGAGGVEVAVMVEVEARRGWPVRPRARRSRRRRWPGSSRRSGSRSAGRAPGRGRRSAASRGAGAGAGRRWPPGAGRARCARGPARAAAAARPVADLLRRPTGRGPGRRAGRPAPSRSRARLARVVQQHQRQQREHLSLVGHELGQGPAEPDRFRGEVDAAAAPALVEDQVDDREDGRQPVGQLVIGRHGERDAARRGSCAWPGSAACSSSRTGRGRRVRSPRSTARRGCAG